MATAPRREIVIPSSSLPPAPAGSGQSDFGRFIVDQNGSAISQKEDGTYQKCETETPGSVIAHSLNTHTDSGVVEAELANDINSVVNALVTQLTSQMLSKGLHALSSGGSGVSGNGYSSADSYISQLQQDTSAGQTAGIYANAVNLIAASKGNYSTASACFTNKIAAVQGAARAASSTASTASMQAYVTSINAAITKNVDPLLSSLNAQLAAAQGGGTSITNASAQSDYSFAQSQAATFNSDAAVYQNTCNTLP